MLENIFGGAGKVLTLVADVERCGRDITALQDDVKELRGEITGNERASASGSSQA